MSNIEFASKQLNKIQKRIQSAANTAGRQLEQITLIGASKRQESKKLQAFYQAGLTHFGENYLQEAIRKQQELSKLATPSWHFIGHIQSNKTQAISQHFDWVHTVDRLKIAQRLSQQRQKISLKDKRSKSLKVLVQLNLDDEQSKSGVTAQQAHQLCNEISQLDYLDLRGLMLIPRPTQEKEITKKTFAQANQLRQSINQRYGLNMSELSMGMSSDFEIAIQEGATLIRIGSALLGERE